MPLFKILKAAFYWGVGAGRSRLSGVHSLQPQPHLFHNLWPVFGPCAGYVQKTTRNDTPKNAQRMGPTFGWPWFLYHGGGVDNEVWTTWRWSFRSLFGRVGRQTL